jgi:cytidylate kinase
MSSSEAVPVITIDGPSGSGKGTLARAVADALGWHLLDSGALYRIIGVMCARRNVSFANEDEVAELAASLDIQFAEDSVLVDEHDLTDEIRTEDAGLNASKVAQMPGVRAAVFELQRRFREPPGLVADGRDMGTVVFADAALKIFLDAGAEERAQRRYKQLKNKGLSVSFPALLAQIEERDARDRGRAIAPLKPADDAQVVDSTSMSIEAVLELVMEQARNRAL